MSKAKIFGLSALTYIVLNFGLMVLYGIVGLGLPFGDLLVNFSGLITAILTPGGTIGNIFGATHFYITEISTVGHMTRGIIGLCWVLIPGLIASLLGGIKLAQESGRNAFIGVFFMILILTSLPLLLSAFLPATLDSMVTTFVPVMYHNVSGLFGYLYPPLVGLFNGIFFGGLAAAASSSL
jgi:hypothetical protein